MLLTRYSQEKQALELVHLSQMHGAFSGGQDLLWRVRVVVEGHCDPRFCVCAGRGGCIDRSNGDSCRRFWLGAYFVTTEEAVLVLVGPHFRHSGVRLRVIVVGIPEEESYSAFLFRYFNLHFDILRRVSLGAPGKSLQPWANYHPAVLSNEFEAVHGLADEVLGRIARVRDAVHAEEV